MLIFIDTEFIEDGRTIDLISVGAIREDGAELYLESDRVDWNKANQWVLDNVKPHLQGEEYQLHPDDIAENLISFCGDDPQFWGYFADYDWVVICQLFGTMIDLPDNWPMLCMDLKQLAIELDDPALPPAPITEHHALADAKWNKEVYKHLRAVQLSRA